MCDTLAHRSFSKQAFRQINELKTTSSLKWLWKAVHLFACVSVIYALISNKLAIDFVELKCLDLLNFPREWKDGYGDFGKSNNFVATKLLPNTFWRNERKKDPQRLEICGTLFDLILIFLFEERWNDC